MPADGGYCQGRNLWIIITSENKKHQLAVPQIAQAQLRQVRKPRSRMFVQLKCWRLNLFEHG
jgi:hypothetical protein